MDADFNHNNDYNKGENKMNQYESTIIVYEFEDGYKADISYNYGYNSFTKKDYIAETSICIKTKSKSYAEKRAKDYLKKYF